MKYIDAIKSSAFLHWLARVVLFIFIWIGFVWITASYEDSKYPTDDGPWYYFYAGLSATVLVSGLYIFADYKYRKLKWNDKSLWRLWVLAIIFALITSPVWIIIMLFFIPLLFTQAFFVLLPIAMIFGVFVVLINK